MMRYTLAGTGARLALLLHHDDAEREVAYDRDFQLSPLVEALDQADGVRHHRGQHEARLEDGFSGELMHARMAGEDHRVRRRG